MASGNASPPRTRGVDTYRITHTEPMAEFYKIYHLTEPGQARTIRAFTCVTPYTEISAQTRNPTPMWLSGGRTAATEGEGSFLLPFCSRLDAMLKTRKPVCG